MVLQEGIGMKINLAPIVEPVQKIIPPSISLSGLTLIINGTGFDLSVIPEGGQAEGEYPFIGTVKRESCIIRYPYSTDIYEPNQSTNPDDYIVELQDGETLACPLIKRPVQENEVEEIIEDGI